LYGYFRRTLTPVESALFGAVTVLGYWAMITEAPQSTFVFLAATAAVMLGVGVRAARLSPQSHARRSQ
jgi:hypothetical protein